MALLPTFRRALLVVAALAAAVLLVACGGDSADDATDPQELLAETFSGEGQVESGVLDISVSAGAGGSGSLTGSISGPFQSREVDQVPLIDLSANVEVTGAGAGAGSFDGAITVTEDAAFLTTDGQAYQVDQATYDSLQASFAASAEEQDAGAEEGSALFGQLGIDPSTWITDVTNEGVEEIDGAETVHISGTPDISKILEDAQRLDPTGSAAGGTGQIAESVESASVDIYTGADDKILRKVDLSIALADPGGSGETLALDLSIGISGVNEDQTIEAPENAQPLEGLLPSGLEGLGGLGGGGLEGLEGLDDGAGLDSLGGSEEYRECVAAAGSPDELAACSELL
jgi:hypothetical protein